MQLTTIYRESLAPELQKRVACFEADKNIYVSLQKQLAEVTQESQRLKQKAAELEGQAKRTDASWNDLAKSATINQDKINEEIERSAQLRKSAQALRVTAEARTGIENNLIVRVAEARMKLVGVSNGINKEYWQAQLSKMFAQMVCGKVCWKCFLCPARCSSEVLRNTMVYCVAVIACARDK